jgi:EAL domain-containing protein (putative c-di-GMP-specific phosphodiesterase class I)
LVEEAGLLQQLDRWVITNLLQWVARHHGSSGNRERDIFFINIAAETLRDVDFPDHVAHQLHKRTCRGSILCFEIAESDVVAHRGDVDAFVRAVRATGCKIALSGFGRNRASIQVLKELPVDFLKIDGSIVLQATRDPVSMGKLVAINRLATSIGIATIAEMVEDDATIASLRKIKVHYGQGFGLSRPQPLSGPD